MQIVSSEPLVLIGPGSEWFWTAISAVVVAITFVAIFRQLRAQRAAGVLEQVNTLQAQWEAREFTYVRLYAMIAFENREVELGMPRIAYEVAAWFDNLAGFVLGGHVSQHVASGYAEPVLFWWTIMKPYVEADRVRFGLGGNLSDVEELARLMGRNWTRQVGRPYESLEPLGERIEALVRKLEVHRDIDRGLIPARPTLDAGLPG
jgi:hypothetical protein